MHLKNLTPKLSPHLIKSPKHAKEFIEEECFLRKIGSEKAPPQNS